MLFILCVRRWEPTSISTAIAIARLIWDVHTCRVRLCTRETLTRKMPAACVVACLLPLLVTLPDIRDIDHAALWKLTVIRDTFFGNAASYKARDVSFGKDNNTFLDSVGYRTCRPETYRECFRSLLAKLTSVLIKVVLCVTLTGKRTKRRMYRKVRFVPTRYSPADTGVDNSTAAGACMNGASSSVAFLRPHKQNICCAHLEGRCSHLRVDLFSTWSEGIISL